MFHGMGALNRRGAAFATSLKNRFLRRALRRLIVGCKRRIILSDRRQRRRDFVQGRKTPTPPLGWRDIGSPKVGWRKQKISGGPEDAVVDLPVPDVRVPPPPDTLPEGLPRACWDSTVRAMLARGIYDSGCSDLVELYCIERARFLEATRQAARHGDDVAKLKPWLRIANAACDRMLRLAPKLGLTPASRHKAVRVRATVLAPAMKFLKP
jgi:Phage terminase, small subunit